MNKDNSFNELSQEEIDKLQINDVLEYYDELIAYSVCDPVWGGGYELK